MEVGNFTDTEKIVLTLSVVFAVLIIGGAVSICCWCISLYKKRGRNIKEVNYQRKSSLRSTDDIEKDLRDLETPVPVALSQIDLTKESSDSETPNRVPPVSTYPSWLHQTSTDSFKTRHQEPGQDPLTVSRIQRPASVSNSAIRHMASDIDVTNTDFSDTSSTQTPLHDTHIGSSSYSISTAGNAVSRGNTAASADNAGFLDDEDLLWPDVCDPYHRGRDLELRIGDKVVDVYELYSTQTTVTRFG